MKRLSQELGEMASVARGSLDAHKVIHHEVREMLSGAVTLLDSAAIVQKAVESGKRQLITESPNKPRLHD